MASYGYSTYDTGILIPSVILLILVNEPLLWDPLSGKLLTNNKTSDPFMGIVETRAELSFIQKEDFRSNMNSLNFVKKFRQVRCT